MNVLVVLNENPAGSHPDVYEAFDRLVEDGLIASHNIYAYPLARAGGSTDAQISAELLDRARDQGTELVIWTHTRDLDVDDATLGAVKDLPRRPLMAYWEKDSYHPLHCPIPRATLRIMRHCSRVFVPGGGAMVTVLARARVAEVRFAPSTASGTRFLPLWSPKGERRHDVVMIGNRVTSRIPFKRWPGARARESLVRAFERSFGSRFAVYGSGWQGRPAAMGPCAFNDQQRVNAGARIAVGVNNSGGQFVFSNRLPIALACGVPLLYWRTPGLDRVLGDCLADRLFTSIPQAITLAERLLESDDELLAAESAANRAFFERNLTTELVARHIIVETMASRSAESGRPAASGDHGRHETIPLWQRIPPLITGGRMHG